MMTFRTLVPLWGHTSQISSSLSPKRDCASKGINSCFKLNFSRNKCVCVLSTYTRPHPAQPVVHDDSSILESYKLCGHKTTPQTYYWCCTLLCSRQSRQCNAMPIVLDTTEARHTHSMKEKKRKKQKNKPREENETIFIDQLWRCVQRVI